VFRGALESLTGVTRVIVSPRARVVRPSVDSLVARATRAPARWRRPAVGVRCRGEAARRAR
jgi:hypothetical protein